MSHRDLRDLDLLIAVAQRGSFAEVARDRDIDPSWVSRTIAATEARLGFRLFHRTTRRMTPTEAGDIYLRRIETIVSDLEQAREDALAVSSEPSGTLRLTATVAFGQRVVVPLIPSFKTQFPQVGIDLILSDSNLDLVSDRIDLAVRLGAGVSGDFVVSKLMDTTYRVCASPHYLDAFGPLPTPHALSTRKSLLFDLPSFRSRWLFRDAAGQVVEVPVQGDIAVTGALALHSLTLAGLGPALLGNWLVDDDLRAGRLVDLFPDHTVTATGFDTAAWLVYANKAYLPRKVRVMIDFLKRHVGKND